jgi:hypothetical protein
MESSMSGNIIQFPDVTAQRIAYSGVDAPALPVVNCKGGYDSRQHRSDAIEAWWGRGFQGLQGLQSLQHPRVTPASILIHSSCNI